jgi:hypothetical protein
MATADRSGKSLVSTIYAISTIPKDDFNAAYVLWKMGAPVAPMAEQLSVAPDRLRKAFRIRYIYETGTRPLQE